MKRNRGELKKFREAVLNFYKERGRILPWRKKKPQAYHVFVSEIMLQQTQVDRVIPKYKAFLKAFPTVQRLACASNKEVLVLWQGLGYNRRALFMKRAAEEIVGKHKGRFPRNPEILETLSGIGPYTARAIAVFAYNQPEVFIETNVRSVYIHHFFSRARKKVEDSKILSLVAETVDMENPREWYAALMDYGTHLKATLPNPSRKSKQHVVQSTFKGSLREIRGRIVRALADKKMSKKDICTLCDDSRTEQVLEKLVLEGLIQKKGRMFSL